LARDEFLIDSEQNVKNKAERITFDEKEQQYRIKQIGKVNNVCVFFFKESSGD
jgi:hypothetical protein